MDVKQDARKSARKFWLSFWFWSIGVFLIYSAFGTLLSLQSSINVIDGLGTITLSIIYGSAVIFTLLFVPTLLRKFGVKKCICGSEIAYVIYTLANMYPTFYTMVPASFIVGVGDCMLWTCMPILNSFYAKQFAALFGNENTNYESKFSGYFYAVFQMSKISGNLITYTVLYGFESQPPSNVTNIIKNMTITDLDENEHLNYCGANDCQDAAVVTETLDQYVPASKVAIYVLMGILAVLSVAAIAIHILFIPNTKAHGMSHSQSSGDDMEKLKEDKAEKLLNDKNSTDENSNFINLSVYMLASNDGIEQNQEAIINQGYISFTLNSLRDVTLQIINSKQLLMTPIIIYCGLDFGFITSELTRSYSACVFGVEWIPVHVVFYGIGASIVCYIVGKLSKRISRNIFFIIAAIIDASMYIYILFWIPQNASHLSIIAVYILMGGMQGIWIPLTHVAQMDYFSERLDVACPVWNVWFMLGIGTQFAWSTSLCVSTKIYTQLGVLVLSMLCYGILEKCFPKSSRNVT